MIVGCVFDDGRSVVYKLVVSAVSSVRAIINEPVQSGQLSSGQIFVRTSHDMTWRVFL